MGDLVETLIPCRAKDNGSPWRLDSHRSAAQTQAPLPEKLPDNGSEAEAGRLSTRACDAFAACDA